MPGPAPPEGAERERRTAPATPRWRPAGLAARVALGALLLALVLREAGLAPVLAAIASADRGGLAVALAMLPGVVLLRTLRWSLLLRGQGVALPWPLLLRALLLGVLAGQLLPTDLAGDATRVVATRRAGAATRTAVGAVFADRLLGSWALLAVAVLGLLAGDAPRKLGLPAWIPAAGLAALALATVAVLVLGRSPAPRDAPAPGRISVWARVAGDTARAFAARRPALLGAAALAVLGKLLIAAQVAVLARSLGAAIGTVDAMVLAPATSLAASLPVSLGGIGLREAAWALAFVRWGEPAAGGVALAWLLYGLLALEGGVGGALALAAAGRRRTAPAPAPGTGDELGSAR